MMKHPLVKLTQLISFCILLATSIQAQEQRADVNLSAITLSGNILKPILFTTGSGTESFHLLKGVRADRVRYTGVPNIVFYREDTTTLDDKGQPTKTVLAQLKLPALTGDFLLLFSRKPGKTESYQVAAIPDDFTTFKAGMSRFINATPNKIALKFGNEQVLLEKYNFADVAITPGGKTLHTTIMYTIMEEQEPILCFRGGLPYFEDKRMIYVISPKQGGVAGSINLDVIRETVL